MFRFSSFFVVLSLSASWVLASDVDFARDIQPILNAKCVECHGGVKAAGGVSFIYSDKVVGFEAESGEVVVAPGEAQASEMIRRITSDDEYEVMPPPEAHGPLTPSEVKLIREWINQGAQWNGHWAFVPPVKPKVPTTTHTDLVVNPIDQFVFRGLELEGLQPSPVEEPGRLLRRLSIALTGLPPTLAELTKFEDAFAKDAQSAVEQAVDQLMAREAFGERWASMWLDLVRYADSGGMGIDQRREIWAYRDWVVRAFNNDMPFDEFTVKQLAGDLLPEPGIEDLVATACQRNTQTNNEGGTDDEEFRVAAVIDRINTTWQTWGGITFGCVQCHDHPYDPFRNVEYYQFMDFFNNSADSDLGNDQPRMRVPKDATDYEKAIDLRRRALSLKRDIWQAGVQRRDETKWHLAQSLVVKSQNGTQYVVDQTPTHAEFHTEGTVRTSTETQIRVPASNFSQGSTTAIRLVAMPLDPEKAVQDPEWGFVISRVQAWIVAGDGSKQPVVFRWSVPDVAWDPADPLGTVGPDGVGWGADSRIHHMRQLVLVPGEPFTVPEGGRLDLHVLCKKTGHGSHPMVIQRGHLASTSDPDWSELGAEDSAIGELQQQLAALRKELNSIPSTSVPIMSERPRRLSRPTNVFVRGNTMEKGQRVDAGLPDTLGGAVVESPTRLEMARWWVSDAHPLTARVFVNRLWEQLYGTGLVATLEDFGSSGEKPSHPELLDYLAVQFQTEHRWSVKAALREMVLAYCYRQSSRTSPKLAQEDPANRMIARGPRLRLPAEMVRDHALAVGGLLVQKVGGPPVRPPLPGGVWQPFDGGDKWTTARTGTDDRYRRSIYTYMKRSIPYPTFATFDAPSREFCTPRRLTSNTPLQALVTLNDKAFVECAEALGQRMGTLSDVEGPRMTMASAITLVTGRQARPDQRSQLNQLLAAVEAQYLKEGSSEMQAAQRARRVVAQVLLNLDDAMTY